MKRSAILLVLPVLASLDAGASGSASGTFLRDDKRYAAGAAVAWRSDPFLKVAITVKALDPALGADGSYDDSDLMASSPSLVITLDAQSRELVGIRLRDDTGSGADFRCEGPGLLTVTKADAASVAGKFKCEEHDVTFDAPLLKGAK